MAIPEKLSKFDDLILCEFPIHRTTGPITSAAVITNPENLTTSERRLLKVEAFYKDQKLSLDELYMSLKCQVKLHDSESEDIFWDSSNFTYPPGITRDSVIEIMKKLFWDLSNKEFKKRRYEMAILHVKKALDLDKSDVRSHSILANVYYKKRRYQESIDHYLQAIEIGEAEEDIHDLLSSAYYDIAIAYRKLGNFQEYSNYNAKYLLEREKFQII